MFSQINRPLSAADLQQMRPAEKFDTEPNYLAGSILHVPGVFREEASIILWPMAAFPGYNVDGPDGAMAAEGSSPFDTMVKDLNELPNVLTEDAEATADLAAEDPDLVPMLDLLPTLMETTTNLTPHMVAQILVDELRSGDPQEVNGKRLLAALKHDLSATFPAAAAAARDLISTATTTETPRFASLQRKERDAGVDLVRARVEALENMGEDATTVLLHALRAERSIPDDKLIGLLTKVDAYTQASWLLGAGAWAPTPNLVSAFGKTLSADAKSELKLEVLSMCEKGFTLPPELIPTVVSDLFIPNVALDPVAATLLWHEIQTHCGDDVLAAMGVCAIAAEKTTAGTVKDI